MALGGKQISPEDPDRADERMISYILRIHFRNTKPLSPKIFEKIKSVFTKAGGSWVSLFNGGTEDFALLKSILKVGLKEGIIPKKKKRK